MVLVSEDKASYKRIFPASGVPMPVTILITSRACWVPMMPASTPSTPPVAQSGTRPGAGGSGYRSR